MSPPPEPEVLKEASSDKRYEILADAWETQTVNLATCNLQINAIQRWRTAVEKEYGERREYEINRDGELIYKAGD